MLFGWLRCCRFPKFEIYETFGHQALKNGRYECQNENLKSAKSNYKPLVGSGWRLCQNLMPMPLQKAATRLFTVCSGCSGPAHAPAVFLQTDSNRTVNSKFRNESGAKIAKNSATVRTGAKNVMQYLPWRFGRGIYVGHPIQIQQETTDTFTQKLRMNMY